MTDKETQYRRALEEILKDHSVHFSIEREECHAAEMNCPDCQRYKGLGSPIQTMCDAHYRLWGHKVFTPERNSRDETKLLKEIAKMALTQNWPEAQEVVQK